MTKKSPGTLAPRLIINFGGEIYLVNTGKEKVLGRNSRIHKINLS